MSFCSSCGRPARAGARFCETCGTAIGAADLGPPVLPTSPAPERAAATPQPPPLPAPGAAAGPPPLPPPSKPRWRRFAWPAALVAAVACAGAAIAIWYRPAPEDAIRGVRAAFAQHDPQAFERYVDLPKVMDDAIDQVVTALLQSQQAGPWQEVGTRFSVAVFKGLYLQRLSAATERLLLGGGSAGDLAPDDPDSRRSQVLAVLADAVRTALGSELSYGGLVAQSRSGDDAVVTVRVMTGAASRPVLVKLRMRWAGDHWRVVGIPELMRQVQQARST